MKSAFFLSAFSIFLVLLASHSGKSQAVDDIEEDETIDTDTDIDDGGSVIDETTGTEESEVPLKTDGSVNADIYVLFTKPHYPVPSNLELPAGKPVEFLVGFYNKGGIEFIIEEMDASFRYPSEYQFHIQNFTTVRFDKKVPSQVHATLAYVFTPADAFAGRPFGLSVGLSYRDEFGTTFYEKVYNETVNIVEVEEGLDGETFFLYIFLAAGVVLLLVIGQQFLYSLGKKHIGSTTTKKQNIQIEIGTKKSNNVDYDWVPKNVLDHLNKQAPKSPKHSAGSNSKQRKPKRSPGSEE